MSLRHIDISSLHPLILRLLLAVGLIVAATACTDEADAPDRPTPADPKVGTISLYLGMGDTFAPASRAASSSRTPEGTYNPGAGFENYIDISGGDFRLYAFDGNTNAGSTESENSILYCEIPNADITIVPVDFGPDNRHYILSFPITQSFKDHFEAVGLKLVLLANWHSSYPTVAPRTDDPAGTETHADPAVAYDLTPDESTLEKLVSNSNAIMGYKSASEIPGGNFAAPLTPAVDRDNLIPLFGVRNYGTLPAIEPGNSHWLSTLNLLRALAKVEIIDETATTTGTTSTGTTSTVPTITSASITRYVTRLYKAPLGVYEESDYKKDSYEFDYGPAPSIPSPEGSNYESDTELKIEKNAAGHFVIYIPEYKNIGIPDNARAHIKLTYSDKCSFEIDFKNYGNPSGTGDGNPFDIRRNYWYVYTVSRIKHDINVHIDVQPYATCEIDPALGLLTDEMGDLMIYKVEDPDNPGNLILPKVFQEYLTTYGKTIPDLEYHAELGDYYAIHRNSDGTLANSEVWLKDRDGDRVMSNFTGRIDNDDECSTRKIKAFVGSVTTDEHKDRDGDIRRQHNADHSSIIYKEDRGLLFKTIGSELYEIESWDTIIVQGDKTTGTGNFFIRWGEDDTHYIFQEYNIQGNPTRKVSKVDKKTGEITTIENSDLPTVNIKTETPKE